jgi:acetylcholinesterase
MPSSNQILFFIALPVIGLALFWSSWLDDWIDPISELWSPIPADAPKVRIAQGLVIGTVLNDSFPAPVEAFMGLPYALPPVDQLRFRRAVPLLPSDHVFKARKYGAMYVFPPLNLGAVGVNLMLVVLESKCSKVKWDEAVKTA